MSPRREDPPKVDGLQEIIDLLTDLKERGGSVYGYEFTPVFDGMRGRSVAFKADVYMPLAWRPQLGSRT